MPNLLTLNPQWSWPLVQWEPVDLFKFLEPYLRNAVMGEPVSYSFAHVHFLYKGILRVLLVPLHDFFEFLCDYHFSFCDKCDYEIILLEESSDMNKEPLNGTKLQTVGWWVKRTHSVQHQRVECSNAEVPISSASSAYRSARVDIAAYFQMCSELHYFI
ncbi:hypothetical protein NE237_032851 [Protea cynaroides]|uniref:CCR4-Not complex component Not1 C-terminal domain-containing protein n=1 Tax=Protea cynaroides TaxID=273540 RepID=A0A9Q0L535_9MAGN|nr:hypothetical protein NE237_032851 [Protea cynaroides]